jgi:outer membrane biosynthesis protein TonB
VSRLPDGLTEKAIEAARRISFTPAEKDGRKVSQYVTIEYNFNIY